MTSKREKVAAPRISVDMGKLRKTSLKRYKKHFKLECKADSKPDLVQVVSLHFESMLVRESDVALGFHNFARTLRGRRIIAGDAPHPSPGPAAAAARATAAAALAGAHEATR